MNDFCIICHDRETLSEWTHPTSKQEYMICDHCRANILGLCQNCQELVFRIERYGYDESGNIICPKCVHMSELAEDACSK